MRSPRRLYLYYLSLFLIIILGREKCSNSTYFFSSLYSGYIGEFEIIDDHRSGKIVIQLNGHLNKTGVISPRFNIQHSQIESWVNLLLPARGFGFLILVRVPCFQFFH